MKTRKIARSGERTFSKNGRMKKLASKFRRVREGCPRPTIVAVLSIQKFSNYFALCYEQVIAVDPRKIKVNISCVFRSC